MTGRSEVTAPRLSVALAVGTVGMLALGWILVVFPFRPLAERRAVIWPLVVAAGSVWIIRPSPPGRQFRSTQGRRRLAVLHALAAVLIVVAWVLTAGALYVVASMDVWKSGKVSFGPLVLVVGALGLIGSLDWLHRTLVPGLSRRASLLAAIVTLAGSFAALVLGGALVLGPGNPSQAVSVLAGVTAFGGPPLLTVVAVILVRAWGRRPAD